VGESVDASGRSAKHDVDIAKEPGKGDVKFDPEVERLALATKVLIGIGAIFVFTIGLNASVQSPVTDKMFAECL
jgi:hypothetical protein